MKILNRKNIFYLYLMALILLSVLPINGTSSSLNNNYVLNIRLDFIAHFAVLIPFFSLLNCKKKEIKIIFATVLIALLFASFLEGLQYFVPYRTFNINDMIANWMGIILSFVFFRFFISRNIFFNN